MKKQCNFCTTQMMRMKKDFKTNHVRITNSLWYVITVFKDEAKQHKLQIGYFKVN